MASAARRPKCPSATALAPIRLVRMERKVDGYQRPPRGQPHALAPIRLVRMERKVDG
jgi:hypothetical protein